MKLTRKKAGPSGFQTPNPSEHPVPGFAPPVAGFAKNSDTHNVGQVITWHPTDALEQSESSKQSRETL
ncbi:MAG: DUF1589 domain-containing protein [Rhodopirellula bahusiensis]